MLEDLAVATREIGLRMHMGKARILSNVPDSSRTDVDRIIVDGNEVKILGYSEAVNYLGAVLTMARKMLKSNTESTRAGQSLRCTKKSFVANIIIYVNA
eukprot:8305225-Karenia_brevis.AAC.1